MKKINKKIKSSRLTMKEVVVSLFIVLLLGISISIGSSLVVNVFAESAKEELKPNKLETEDLKKSPYTLDEIYDIISSGDYWKTNYLDENWIDLNIVLTHFYDYFTKDTKFMIYDKTLSPYFNYYDAVDDAGVVLIDYDEYMKIAYDYEKGGIITMIRSGEERLKEQDNRRGRNISIAAKELVGSCAIINKCANSEVNNKL